MARPPRDRDDDAVISSTGRIDPAVVDVVTAPKPRRTPKPRKVPDPPAELRRWALDAEKRMHKRPYPPNVILEPAGFDEERWTAPHSDVDLWTLQVASAFGTRSRSVFVTFMRQLEALCSRNFWDEGAHQWRISEEEYSALLGIVNSIQPRNEAEAMLAAQAVAVHLMVMKTAAQALKYDGDVRTAAVSGKLARTYIAQLDSIQRLRGRGKASRQTIKVSKELHHHQHIHVTRGGGEDQGQSHATDATGVPRKIPALPCADESGDVVPIARGSRKA